MNILTNAESHSAAAAATTLGNIIPLPVSVTPAAGVYRLAAGAGIYVDPGTNEVMAVGQYLADRLNPSTGYQMHVRTGTPPAGNIYLTMTGTDSALGDEGYDLTIKPEGVTLAAYKPAGLFRGIQTIRQLFPPAVESSTVQPGPWEIPAGTIHDYARFGWRGVMLDVARHFFKVADVKRYLDELAYYKVNYFHLHLSDDQGWRIMINKWPGLATVGGTTAVNGDPGGYYTQAEYADLVAYAQRRYITVVPEIDTPGHTNAALASYAELNCNGIAPALYSGIEVGFSSLCIGKEITYTFLNDVIKELAALTPGPYIHIGGDEAKATNPADYVAFAERVQAIVQANGKQMVGWEEISQSKLLPTSIAQHWTSDVARKAVQQGAKVLMSPASKAYLDMKYDPSTVLGLTWAGYIDLPTAYNWDPASQVTGITDGDIVGIEAPLWSETLRTLGDVETMTFPRLPGYAEIGWSPAAGRSWDEYRVRLGTQSSRLTAMGIKFFQSPQVNWK